MKYVIDTLTEYRDIYKDKIDNLDVVTLPVYREKYNQYSEALKNMESSSRIIDRYIAIQWYEGNPIIDGCPNFPTDVEAANYCLSLPKVKGVTWTVAKTTNHNGL